MGMQKSSFWFNSSQGASLGDLRPLTRCPIEKVTLGVGLLLFMLESETEEDIAKGKVFALNWESHQEPLVHAPLRHRFTPNGSIYPHVMLIDLRSGAQAHSRRTMAIFYPAGHRSIRVALKMQRTYNLSKVMAWSQDACQSLWLKYPDSQQSITPGVCVELPN